jgi:uncharacterized membrane protein
MTNENNVRKILEKDRISALTDGIFAFSMTLLIVGIAVPEIPKITAPIELGAKLKEMMPSINDFILSFILLAVFWNLHQKQFNVIKYADERLSWINILLLLAVVFIPFTTNLQSKYDNSTLAVTIFNINLLIISLFYYFIWKYAEFAKLVDKKLSSDAIRFAGNKNIIIIIVSLVALVLGFIIPQWYSIVYITIPFILLFMERKRRMLIGN